MKSSFFALFFVAGLALQVLPGIRAAEAISQAETEPVVLARVNGESVTIEDLQWRVDEFHGSVSMGNEPVKKPDALAVLERVIDGKLIVQEARNIGLAELPEVANRLEEGRLDLLKRLLVERRLETVTAGEPEQIEALYRDSVREIELESLFFQTKEDAEAFNETISAGAEFATAAQEFVESGTVESVPPAQYVKTGDLLPEITSALLALEQGMLSEPMQLSTGYTVARVLDVRYPEDPAARAAAEAKALEMLQLEVLANYTQDLRTRYVKPDRELVETLDFGATEEELQKLRKDRRVAVKIKGGTPVRVSDLTRGMEEKYFHGLDRATERERINKAVWGVLDKLALSKAVWLEAERLGIDESPEYRITAQDQEESMLFGTFVSKVINPEIKLEESELEQYYAEHTAEFTTPSMMRVESLVFREREQAENAMEKLRQGTNLDWLRSRAEGQLDPTVDEMPLVFDGRLLMLSSMPEHVRTALTGAIPGDIRFTAPEGGPYYALIVREVVPSKTRDYAEVREKISKIAFASRRDQQIARWNDELREASEIEILVDGEELEVALGLRAAESE